MKKRLLALLLASCMLLAGCGAPQQETTGDPTGQVQTTPAPADDGFTALVTGQIDDPEQLATEEQRQLLQSLMDGWYAALAAFRQPELAALFSDETDAAMHAAALRTLTAIRQQALVDLRMQDVSYTLTVTAAEPEDEEGFFRIEAEENAAMHFAATPETDSRLYAVPHIFQLEQVDGAWRIHHHEADDNPYFSLTYQEGLESDARQPQLLRAIERRQLQRQETVQVTLSCDHPYDRAAAEDYMRQYDHQRSARWFAYDDVGGNCMNFGSQVLLAGGIPMDEEGGSKWYWHGQNDLDLSWINVGRFYSYARDNRGFGLVADPEANYYTGEVGDILILGPDGGHNHTTLISGIIRNPSGEPVDYLLCSNTTNYTDFPAGAYYYTSHRLIKIYGWNDSE